MSELLASRHTDNMVEIQKIVVPAHPVRPRELLAGPFARPDGMEIAVDQWGILLNGTSATTLNVALDRGARENRTVT